MAQDVLGMYSVTASESFERKAKHMRNNPSIWSSWDHSSVQKQPLYTLQINVSLIFIGEQKSSQIFVYIPGEFEYLNN